MSLRVLIIFGSAGTFYGLSLLFPDLLKDKNLLLISSVFGLAWILLVPVFNRLSTVSEIQGLTSRQHERLTDLLVILRRRFWRMGETILACIVTIVVISTRPDWTGTGISVGVLVGIALYYLSLVPAWHEEIQKFIDHVARERNERKQLEDALKEIDGASKTLG